MESTEGMAEEKNMSGKDRYIEKRKKQIDKLNTELDDLEAKILTADLESKAKAEHEKIVADLRQKREEARVKLAEIQAAGDTRWEEIKDGLEGVWTSIRHGIEKVKTKF